MSKTKGRPVDKVERVLFGHIADMSGWNIARYYKCGYDGDHSVIPHGGFFYDARDWETYGYASCVEFWTDDDTGLLRVQCGTINKPDDDDMERMEEWSGMELTAEALADPHVQISLVRDYRGIEPAEDFSGPFVKLFDLGTWQEWRIWRSVHNWLKELGS